MFRETNNLTKEYQNLLGGAWIDSSTNEFIEIQSPVDQSLLGKIPAMSKDDVDRSIENAKEASFKWKHTPLNERLELLEKASDLLEKNKTELTHIIMLEVAKDKKSAESEISRTADFIRFTASIARGLLGESILSDSFKGYNAKKVSIVKREPLGTVLAISPFNYPINLAASKIAPALAMGNTVVFKPATQSAISGLYLAKIFADAGLPGGVLNTITGKGSVLGDHCVSHKKIDFINFTGSTEVGKHIASLAVMKPLLMELGGKDAAIVLENADLDLAAQNIVSGAYSYSGQRCTAVKRVLVPETIADTLVTKIKDLVLKLKVGNPLKEQVDIGPLIDKKAADFVEELMNDAIQKGAKCLTGGERVGNTISPALFDYVTEDMRLAWEEPFGPVLPIIRVKSIQDAIAIANASEYGLQGAVFTENIDDAFSVAEQLEVGTVQINNKTERGPDHFPFLGVKSSGVGTQGIRYSLESMSRPKGIVVNLH